MSLLGRILVTLDTPDNQGRDWYGWASNQLSHVFIGAFIGLYFYNFGIGGATVLSVIMAVLKKISDLARVPTWNTVKDAWHDITFWVIGTLFITNIGDVRVFAYLSIGGTALLLAGVLERAVRASSSGGQ
jgi:hypothetical protein